MSEIIKDSYKTIDEFCREEKKIKNSRFIASAFPIKDRKDAEKFFKTVKKEFFNAHHHPFAYIYGFNKEYYRFSDEGEPSGTSGKSIFNAIEKYSLTNIIVIVSRYFGGTKLGTGGLKQAYFSTADLCLSKCKIVEKFIEKEFYIEYDYAFLNSILNFINKKKIKIKENKSDTIVRMNLLIRSSLVEDFKKELNNLTRGKIKLYHYDYKNFFQN